MLGTRDAIGSRCGRSIGDFDFFIFLIFHPDANLIIHAREEQIEGEKATVERRSLFFAPPRTKRSAHHVGHAENLRFERARPIDSRMLRALCVFFQHRCSMEYREFQFQWNSNGVFFDENT